MMNTASITDLKQNTAALIKKVRAEGKSMVILQRSQPAAVLVDPSYFVFLESLLEDIEDVRAIKERRNEPKISIDKVAAKLGL